MNTYGIIHIVVTVYDHALHLVSYVYDVLCKLNTTEHAVIEWHSTTGWCDMARSWLFSRNSTSECSIPLIYQRLQLLTLSFFFFFHLTLRNVCETSSCYCICYSYKQLLPQKPLFFLTSFKVNQTKNAVSHVTEKVESGMSSVLKTLLCQKNLKE